MRSICTTSMLVCVCLHDGLSVVPQQKSVCQLYEAEGDAGKSLWVHGAKQSRSCTLAVDKLDI